MLHATSPATLQQASIELDEPADTNTALKRFAFVNVNVTVRVAA